VKGALTLKSVEFRRERERTWIALDRLVSRAERNGLGSLGASDLARLPVLYRATLSSLSVARAISLDRNLVEFLESLSARAYVQVYGPKRGVLRTMKRFLAVDFPRSFRRRSIHVGLALLFLLAGMAAGFFLSLGDPDNYYAFVSEDMAQGRTPAASTEHLKDVLYDGGDKGVGALGGFTTFLFTNNARVGMLCFALGFAAGVPVFLLLFQNGLMLGAMAALHHERGLSADFWGWILPHGITEMLAIVICGGAGLLLAQSLIFPGRRTRFDNFRHHAREASALVLGAVLMLLFAGIIEGIFRQTVHSMAARYAVAALTLLTWVAYFGFVGRVRR